VFVGCDGFFLWLFVVVFLCVSFGFLSPVDGSPDLFVHQSVIVATSTAGKRLQQGQQVEYQVMTSEQGKYPNPCI